MNVVLIADDGPANAWLIREIEQAHEIQLIIRPDWSVAQSARTPVARAPGKALPFRYVTRAIRRAYFERRDRATTAALTRALFGSGSIPRPLATVRSVPSWDINGPATEALLRDAAPDLVVVSGAPLLRSNIYDTPRLGSVNLHFGISPAYRGMHTLLVPWQRRDYEHLGATLHRIDDGVDTGPVLFRAYPDLHPADSLVAIEAKIVRQVSGALCRFLATVFNPPTPRPLVGRSTGSVGLVVRYHDRTIMAELGDRARRLAGERPPSRNGRVETFYSL